MNTRALESPSRDSVSAEPEAPRRALPRSFRWLEAALPRELWLAYGASAALCLVVIWLPRYPMGIDLPQHATLFQIIAGYDDPRSGYRHFYSLDFFTPYALLYLLAWPLTKVGGALFATKSLLTVAALATPLSLSRWLRAVGGEPTLALLGFPTVFAYAYQWGFFSMTLAVPIATAYLAAAAELRAGPTWRRFGLTSGLGVGLFFCHGIVFGVTMLASGLIVLFQRNLRRMALELAHFVPILAVLVPWYMAHRTTARSPIADLAGTERVANAFWALFTPLGSRTGTLGGIALAALVFIMARPVLARTAERLVPLGVSLLGLLLLPDFVFDTAFVGSRFAHFVYVFAPAAFDVTVSAHGLRALRRSLTVAALVVLSVQLYRLVLWNQELAGIDELAIHLPEGADVKVFADNQDSVTGGRLGQGPAWIVAQRGGILENSGTYFQLPARRRSGVPWPAEFGFLFVRGTEAEAARAIGSEGRPLAEAWGYHLFVHERTLLQAPGLSLVRWAQSQGSPAQDRALGGGALQVAGSPYARGFGVHGESILQVRVAPGAKSLSGLAGMDDGAEGFAAAVFRIQDAARRTLWESEVLRTGAPAVPFRVDHDDRDGDLFLLTEHEEGYVDDSHADWLDVEAR